MEERLVVAQEVASSILAPGIKIMTVKEFKIQYALGSLSYRMKLHLAILSNTPKKILTMLSRDKAEGVKYWVALNPKAPEEVLKILLKDKCHHIVYEARQTLKRKTNNAGVA